MCSQQIGPPSRRLNCYRCSSMLSILDAGLGENWRVRPLPPKVFRDRSKYALIRASCGLLVETERDPRGGADVPLTELLGHPGDVLSFGLDQIAQRPALELPDRHPEVQGLG